MFQQPENNLIFPVDVIESVLQHYHCNPRGLWMTPSSESGIYQQLPLMIPRTGVRIFPNFVPNCRALRGKVRWREKRILTRVRPSFAHVASDASDKLPPPPRPLCFVELGAQNCWAGVCATVWENM